MKTNKIKPLFKTMAAGIIMAMLCLPILQPVQGAQAEEPVTALSFSKTLEMDEHVTLPEVTFHYTVTPSESNPDGSKTFVVADVISGTMQKGQPVNALVTYSNAQSLALPDYTSAGLYTYTVTESTIPASLSEGELTVKSGFSTTYKVEVLTANQSDQNAVYIEAVKISKQGDLPEAKTNTLAFASVYGRTTSEADNNQLVISKTVAGDHGDRNKAFAFELTLHNTATASGTDTYTVKGPGDQQDTITVGTPKTFALKHGESIMIEGLPVGTTYDIKEVAADHYDTSIIITENGIAGQQVKSNTASGKYVGEAANSAAFTNTFDETSVVPTGIFMNNLPFILIISISALSMGIYLISRRRRSND